MNRRDQFVVATTLLVVWYFASNASAGIAESIILKNGTGADVHVQIVTEAALAAGGLAQEFPMRGNGALKLQFDSQQGKFAINIIPDDEPNTLIPYRNVDLHQHALVMKGRPLILKGEVADVICPWTGQIANLRLRMWLEGRGPIGRTRVFLNSPVFELAVDQLGGETSLDRSRLTRLRR